jgi:CDGSH iron-sulfur domain-containing protein 3
MILSKTLQNKPIILKTKPGIYWWCACGLSEEQPFCDGSHKVTDFVPIETNITEEKTIAWCACKQTKNKPFCDGAHKNLSL